jgi:nucleoside-diphosphate-sugar epimerase
LGRDIHLNFDGLRRPGDPPSLVGLDQRARSWGWMPQMNWRDGVKRYASWYLQNIR